MSYMENACFNSTSKVEDEDRLISYRSIYNKVRKLAMDAMAKGDKKSNLAYSKVREILENAPSAGAEKVQANVSLDDTIIGMTVLYGVPAVLFKHNGGYAWKHKNEIKDLGKVTRERAIEMFEWNFNKCM